MPVVHGPYHLDKILGSPDQSLQVQAATLGEALDAYQEAFGVRITPETGYDGRYFLYLDLSLDNDDDPMPIDVHVRRGDEDFCARQDRDLPLQDDDLILLMGLMAC